MRRGNQTQTQTNHTMKSLHNPGYIISTSSCLGAGFAVVEDAVTIATKEVWSALDIRLRVTMVTHIMSYSVRYVYILYDVHVRVLYDVHCSVRGTVLGVFYRY